MENTLTGYFCICRPNTTPMCGFGSLHSAMRYRMENAIGGSIRYFDTATMQFSKEEWL